MKKIIITAAFLAMATIAMAQPGNPQNPVPLDGGLSLLLAAGAAYGAKKWNANRKEKEQDAE
jgi:hypothetical protein